MFVRKAIWPGFSGIRLESNDWFPFHLLFKQHDLVISVLSLSLHLRFSLSFFPSILLGGDYGLLLLGIGQLEKLFPFVHEKHDLVVLFIYFYLFFFFSVLRFLLVTCACTRIFGILLNIQMKFVKYNVTTVCRNIY